MPADVPFDAPVHPAMERVLYLNAKAAELQARADVAPGPAGIGFGFRAELRRASCRIALAEVVGGGDG